MQKRVKLAPTDFLTQTISTKNTRFTTFPNLRQNSVNAFEIKYFYATNGDTNTATGGSSTGAISTGATTVGAISNVMLETKC